MKRQTIPREKALRRTRPSPGRTTSERRRRRTWPMRNAQEVRDLEPRCVCCAPFPAPGMHPRARQNLGRPKGSRDKAPRVMKPKRKLEKHPLLQLYPPGSEYAYSGLSLSRSLNSAHRSVHGVSRTMNAFPPPLFGMKSASSGLRGASLAGTFTIDCKPMYATEFMPPVSLDSSVPAQGTKLDLSFICS